MKFEEEAILLTAESKPYNVEGNTGTSHRVRLSINGEIYSCKSTEAQVASLKGDVGKRGTATVVIKSRKENLSIELESFEKSDEE